MKQFDICRLKAAGGKGKLAGRVLVLQAELMDQIETRVVAPLVPINALPAMAKLRPEFVIEGKRLRLIADRMSVLRCKELGPVIASARDREWDIRRALDLVLASGWISLQATREAGTDRSSDCGDRCKYHHKWHEAHVWQERKTVHPATKSRNNSTYEQ